MKYFFFFTMKYFYVMKYWRCFFHKKISQEKFCKLTTDIAGGIGL